MHQYILLLGLLLLSCPLFATCVVVIRTPTEIIVGADSRRLIFKGDGTSRNKIQDDYCKIRQAGKFYYAFVGFDDVAQKKYADLAAEKAQNLQEFVKLFCEGIGPYYADKLANIRQANPTVYTSDFTGERQVFAELPFFAFENGIPQVIVVRLSNTTNENERIRIQPYFRVNELIYILGYWRTSAKVYPTFDSLNNEATRIGMVGLIRKIIDIESKAYPDKVGGPVYVLRLTSDKKEWVDGKEPDCSVNP